jgi:hypothetical protein
MSSGDKAKVVDYLKGKDDWVPTLDIAKEIKGKKASTKDINPLLYAMKDEGLLEKMAEANGSKPRWRLIQKENKGKEQDTSVIESKMSSTSISDKE